MTEEVESTARGAETADSFADREQRMIDRIRLTIAVMGAFLHVVLGAV